MNDTTERVTLEDFITELGITATVTPADDNPCMEDVWNDASHWRITLRRGRTRITTPFSQGSAHTEPPTAEDALNALISDASSADQDFDSWCQDYGYDTDSRKAHRTYKAVQAQTSKLRRLLGEDFDRIGNVEGL